MVKTVAARGGWSKDGTGTFYGTTEDYGPAGWSCHFFGCGSVFVITPEGGLTTLYAFCGPQGYPPCKTGEGPGAGLVLATDGNFYGTTEWGGGGNRGEVFRITPNGSLVRLAFNEEDGLNPASPLVQGADGDLYGTTGGTSAGSVFKVSPPGVLTVLYSFCSLPNCADGSGPAGLVQATDGNFYGTTQSGGTGANCTPLGCGTIFKITPRGVFTTLYSFCSQPNCADGIFPTAPLVQATDGNLYGTTSSTAFRFTLPSELTTLYTFCSQPNCADGNDANGLVQATDGNFYGTTQAGGNQACGIPPEYDCGTIFELTPAGTLTTVHSFDGTDGWEPRTGVLQATNGTFYGTTEFGGGCVGGGCGTIFSLSTGLGPFVAFVQKAGKVRQTAEILGQGFTGTTSVSFNGVSAKFTVQSDTYLTAKVPAGATTGYVAVTTPSGVLKSNVPFQVIR